ncbi:MAG: tetratricopeptide repeat protein [Candidatus Eisenbacteria bacterium]|nr:tetratricopeptide repeat protein [Candidatus Eisenbacteria bacterium]
MHPQTFARLKEILLTLPQLPAGEKEKYLSEACADDPELRERISAILKAGESPPEVLKTAGLAELIPSRLHAEPQPTSADPLPKKIGPYLIRGILGEGGMGTVYHAVQTEPIQRDVALKLIRHGLDVERVAARFEAERQTLAIMEHSGIAKVFDAGVDQDARPYFAMEFVRGMPIRQYCELHDPSLRDRLDLFRIVCLAVQHAHQKGIIHRDLKPSNILVAVEDKKPQPKLIDFGIAKALSEATSLGREQTREGLIVGTIAYMSPEQVHGDSAAIDTRSDVYSLGVILYELIAGRLPYNADSQSTWSSLQAIRQEAPQRLKGRESPLGRIDGELETIVFKALEKEPERRYPSAGELAEDIDRYLTDRPIQATPPGTAYQLRKLVKRHRAIFASTVAFVLLLIAFGITMSALRHQAVTEARKAEAVSDFLQGMLSANHIEQKGRDALFVDVLREGANQVDRLDTHPEVRGEVQRTIGESYKTLGLLEEAERHERAALADLEAALGRDHPKVATTIENLSELLIYRGKVDEAEALLLRSLEIRRRSGRDDPIGAARSLNQLAILRAGQGRPDEAEPAYREALVIRREELGDSAEATASSMNDLAVFLWGQNRCVEAEPLYRQALKTYRRIHGDKHTDVATMTSNLGLLLGTLGKFKEGERLLRRAEEVQKELLGDDAPGLAVVHANLAANLICQSRYEAADRHYTRSIAILEDRFGEEHFWTATALMGCAVSKHLQGEYAAAESLYQRSRTAFRGSLPEKHSSIAEVESGLASVWLDTGRARDAEPVLRACVEVLREALLPTHWKTGLSVNALGRCLALMEKRREADSLLTESLPALSKAPIFNRRLAVLRTAELYDRWAQLEKAAEWRALLEPTDSPRP